MQRERIKPRRPVWGEEENRTVYAPVITPAAPIVELAAPPIVQAVVPRNPAQFEPTLDYRTAIEQPPENFQPTKPIARNPNMSGVTPDTTDLYGEMAKLGNGRNEVAEPVAEVKKLSPLEKTRAEISERQNRKFNDKWGLLDTLKAAGLGGLKGFAATGTLGGLLGGAGVGAMQGTIDPNTDEKWSNENRLANLYGVAKQQEAQAEFDAKQRKAEQEAIRSKFDTEGVFLSNQNKALENVRTANKPFYDSITADDQITTEEAAQAKDLGFGDVQPYDARKFETTWVNGKPMTAPTKGVPVYARNPSLPDDALKVPVESTVGGDKFVSTSPQAMTARVGVEQANTNRAVQQSQFETKIKEDNLDDERKRKDDEQKRRDDLAEKNEKRREKRLEAQAKLDKAEATRKTLEAKNGKGYYDKEIAEADGEIAAAKRLINENQEEKPSRTPLGDVGRDNRNKIRPKRPNGKSNKKLPDPLGIR